MPNTLIIPNSGTIYFSTETAGASTIPSLTGQAVSLAHDGQAGLVVSSLNTSTSATNRFRVNGANGALLAVTDEVTGTVFSVNDPAGLPIISADTGLNDVITMGTFGSNALVVRNDKVGVGTTLPTEKLTVSGNISASGNVTASNLAYSIGDQTIAGVKTFSNNIVGNGTANRLPNQLAVASSDIITKGLADSRYTSRNERITDDTTFLQTTWEQFLDFDDQYNQDINVVAALVEQHLVQAQFLVILGLQ
jgi:hypothetical protein